MPWWLKILYSGFLAFLVPVYWRRYGPGNFLWFSDIALFLAGAALWTESGLLASLAALGVLLLELAWNFDYFLRLLAGRRTIGLSDYMFRSDLPPWLRALSLFHVPLPVLLVWMVHRLGYDPLALPVQVALAWVVLPATYLLTKPEKNVNWVHGFGRHVPQRWMAPWAWVALLMAALPVVVYLPTHVVLRQLFPAPA